MNQFETKVYATVCVTVLGTNFSTDPQAIANRVADAVCADSKNWMQPVDGSVSVTGEGGFDVGAVEFDDRISGVLVKERDPDTGKVVAWHEFDENCQPLEGRADPQKVIEEVVTILEAHPDADVGNAKVHFALMRLKALLPSR